MEMSEVIESIEREAFERATKPVEEMSLVEYAEKVCPFPLSDFQKELIAEYEKSIDEDRQFYFSSGRMTGRDFITRLVREWERQHRLTEYRCSCGRLLGRFKGQAEVKCQKCGKMNSFNKCMKSSKSTNWSSYIEVHRDSKRWVHCPYCGKSQFPVDSDTMIKNLVYKCKGSNCKKDFVINIDK